MYFVIWKEFEFMNDFVGYSLFFYLECLFGKCDMREKLVVFFFELFGEEVVCNSYLVF